jgi:hypothetical protein
MRAVWTALCLATVLATTLISLASQTAAPDLTGAWTGKFSAVLKPGAPPVEEDAFAVLTQKGAEITGTVGPGQNRQFPIKNGKVETTKDGTTVTFDEGRGDPPKHFELKLVNGQLRGTMKDGATVVTVELLRETK